jgi:hypothetical protein
MLAACISHRHTPDDQGLVQVDDCREFSGQYRIASSAPDSDVYQLLFDAAPAITAVNVAVTDTSVEVVGVFDDKKISIKLFGMWRATCIDSVLTLYLNEDSSADGVVMEIAEQKLQLFAPRESMLNLRLIDTQWGFLYIVPFYISGDDVLELERLH